MAVIELAMVGIASYTGIQVYRRRTKKLSLIDIIKDEKENDTSFFTNLDARYQHFIQTKIDPLISGQNYNEQMEHLQESAELNLHDFLDEDEADVNRYLAVSLALMGIASLGHLFFPPLMLLAVAGAIYLTKAVYVVAYQSIRQEKRVKTELIAGLYISGMWLAGYFVFGALTCFLFGLGMKVVIQMENRSRRGVTDIFGLQPRFAWRIVDGIEVQTAIEDLKAGDIVVINAGEPLPVDGVITEGLASIDQRALTGESQPVEKGIGDPVLAATLMLTGKIRVRVEKAGQETAAKQISIILAETANFKTKQESKVKEISDKSALPNLLVSLVALPVCGFKGAVAVLGAGFGVNMRTCSVLSMMNYLQIAARDAILIKDGRALERLHTVDTFVFDKTGTLTLEQPHVAQIHCCQENLNKNAVLTYAAAAEYRQPHPIAKAILVAAEERDLTVPQIDEASYEVGYGIQVTMDKQLIRVGSERFMQMEEITIPESIQTQQTICQHKGHSLVMVAVDELLIGAIELHATSRPEVESVIADLRQRGLNLAIISGDQEEPTRELAQLLGIDDYFANTLPENKALLIEQLQNEGRVVCFIGDGINDAIALKQADVSISLLGATTIATDTAQIVLMDQSLAKLGDLLDLAASFDRTIQQGFWTTMIPGVICIGGVFFLHFGIVAAELLFQLGFFTGLGTAMLPLLREQRQNPDEESSALQSVSAGNGA